MPISEHISEVTSEIRALVRKMENVDPLERSSIVNVDTQQAINDLFLAASRLFSSYNRVAMGYQPRTPNAPMTPSGGVTTANIPTSPQPAVSPSVGPPVSGPQTAGNITQTTCVCPNPNCGYTITIALS